MKKTLRLSFCAFVILAEAVLFFLLFQKYMTNILPSDFLAHFSAALNGKGYSLAHIIMKITYKLFGSVSSIAVLTSLIVVLTSFAISYCIYSVCKVLDSSAKITFDNFIIYFSFGTTMLFFSSIYVPRFFGHFYIKLTVSTQPWHNSTYLLMRLAAFLTVAVYFRIRDKYATQKTTLKEYLIFTLLLTITNFAKPNFFIAFAPVMLLALIFDFINSKSKSFKYAVRFGIGVIISLLPVIFQTVILYGQDDGSSMIISTSDLFAHFITKEAVKDLIFDLSFPVIATVIIVFDKIKNKNKLNLKPIIESWLFLILSTLQSIFILEQGPRQNDGNFAWGKYCFAVILNAVCVSYILTIGKKNKKIFAVFGVYALHIISGILYFLLVNRYIGNYINYII